MSYPQQPGPQQLPRKRRGCLVAALITLGVVVAFTILVIVLAVVGGGSSDSASSTTSTVPTPTRQANSSPESVAAAVGALRQQFPDLVQGRDDKAVGDDVRNTCSDLAREDRTTVEERTGKRFTRGAPVPGDVAREVLVTIERTGCTPR